MACQHPGHLGRSAAARGPATYRPAPRGLHVPILAHRSGQDGAIPEPTRRLAIALAAGLLFAGCTSAPKGANAADDLDRASITDALVVTSPAFGEGETVPPPYTCKGAGTSPPLSWQGVPDGTASLAIVVDDPDAPGGTYVHWIVTGLAPTTTAVDEGRLPDGAVQSRSSAGRASYAPPCPPKGQHRYRFTVYALSTPPAVAAGAPTDGALQAIKAVAKARGRITGRVEA